MASVTKRKWTYNGVEKEAWQVRYKDEGGAYRGKQFETKKQADAFRRKVEREMDDGVHLADRASPTVNAVFDMFYKHAEQREADGRIGLKRLTLIRYTMTVCMDDQLGKMRFRDVREADVDAWYRRLQANGRMIPRSARARLVDLRGVEEFANKRGLLKTRPVSAAIKELRGIPQAEIPTFSMEQIGRILKASAERGKWCHPRTSAYLNCFVHLAAFCGLRRGEIAGLRVEDVDVERRMLRIRRSVTQWNTLKPPKSRAGIRDVPMPVHVLALLQEWLTTYHVENEHGLLLTAASGNPAWGNMAQPWRDLLERVGLTNKDNPFHFHALRHFYASIMLDAGAPVTDAATLLGHAKFDTTLQVYAHSLMRLDQKHDLADRIADRMLIQHDTTATQQLVNG